MEPTVPNRALPRYTQRPLPTCRYLPGRSGPPAPHPHTAPTEYFRLQAQDKLRYFSANQWRTCEPYLYGIDLFNHGYWWEAHEIWEMVWLAAGKRSSLCGRFVQGLIQLAGAQLKRITDEKNAARSLSQAAIEKLTLVEGTFLGIEITPLIEEINRFLHEDRGEFPHLELHF